MPPRRRFIAIGHITNDIGTPDRVGGSVAYTAVAAQKRGVESHIITKCPKDHPYVEELREYGVTVHVLKSERDTITTFQNTYDASGNRTQRCSALEEPITVSDFLSFPLTLLEHAHIVVAPVLGEVDERLFPLLYQYGTLSVLPQGYFRTVDADGTIRKRLWDLLAYRELLHPIESIVLSEEDIAVPDTDPEQTVALLRQSVPLVALTRGARGSTIYTTYRTLSIPPFPLTEHEIVDYTGAGDTYAAALLTERACAPLKEAAVFASLNAAVKLTAPGTCGIAAIPSKRDLLSFAIRNYDRVSRILKTRSSLMRAARSRLAYMDACTRNATLAEVLRRIPSRGT